MILKSDQQVLENIIAQGNRITFSRKEEPNGLWLMDVYADENWAFQLKDESCHDLENQFLTLYKEAKKSLILSKTRQAIFTKSRTTMSKETTGICVSIDGEIAFVLVTTSELEIFKELTGM